MMAAGAAAEAGAGVTLLEKNDRLGKKLRITGKGRCNVTNACGVQELIANVPANGRFLFGAVSRFTPWDLMSFFEERGLALKTERGDRVFPCSDKAGDVVQCLQGYVEETGCCLAWGAADKLLLEEGAVKGVQLRSGRCIEADAVVVACGGMSYPLTGSTGDGYRLARQAGHRVVPPVPSLVPLTAAEDWCRDLQGLSLRNVSLWAEDVTTGKTVYKDFGELLFTHFGLSGPLVLSASAHMRPMQAGRYRVHINLKPALSEQQLDLRLQRDFTTNRNRDFINSLGALLPRKLIPVAVRLSEIEGNLKCNQITREQRQAFARLLQDLTLTVQGFRPIEEAIVTAGGVAVDEVNPATMGSKLVSGLYFAGEVLDVDAYTGGFNLQIAFSTGRLAGQAAAKTAG